MNKAGNAIDDQPKTLFARAQGLLDAPPVVNIGNHCAPANDTSIGVPQGSSAGMDPPVNAVCTSRTVFDIIRLPGFDRAAPQADYTLAIIRMEK
jgi:hypothetical protein